MFGGRERPCASQHPRLAGVVWNRRRGWLAPSNCRSHLLLRRQVAATACPCLERQPVQQVCAAGVGWTKSAGARLLRSTKPQGMLILAGQAGQPIHASASPPNRPDRQPVRQNRVPPAGTHL